MAVVILERGTPKSEVTYALQCYSCKTKFRYLTSDAKYNTDFRDGDFLSINCPVCYQYCTQQVAF